MPKINVDLEIPSGCYTKQELTNLINDKIKNISDSRLKGYSTDGREFNISFSKIIENINVAKT